MAKLTDTQRKVLYFTAAIAAAYLAYRWYTGRRQTAASNAAGSTAAPDTTSSDYAALAGQEQGDVAALQQQNSQLLSQEQSDVAALQAQEGADVAGINQTVSGLTSGVDSLTSQFADLFSAQSELGQKIAELATGTKPVDRTKHSSVPVRRGSPFWHYYKRVSGHNPPAHVAVTDWIYRAFKSGVKADRIKTHPSARNNHIQHPNGDHKQHSGSGRRLQRHDKKHTSSPPKASKPRHSGAHKGGQWRHGNKW